MRVKTGLVLAVLLVGLSSAALAQPTVQQLLDRVQALEANLRVQQKTIKALEDKCASMDISAELDKKLAALRDELKAEIQAGGGAGPLDFRVYWNDGIRMDTVDKSVKLKIGGRLLYDMAMFCSDESSDGAAVRSARIYFAGTFGEHCGFKLEWDFYDGDAALRNAYIEFRNVLGLDSIRVGHFKEPFSLEYLTSARFTTFMERGLPVLAFNVGYNYGIMFSKGLLDDRILVQAGVFGGANSYGAWWHDYADYAYTVRVSGTPVHEDDGKRLVHVGAAWSCRTIYDDVSYAVQPESYLSRFTASTGGLNARHVCLWGAEVAVVRGPLSFQAELMGSNVSGSEFGHTQYPDHAFCCNWYASVSWFITGEHRAYDKKAGAFDRVKVLKPFCNGKGPGAWELAARYSSVDLRGTWFHGSLRQADITLGVNWYLNNNMRVMLNYVCASVNEAENVHLVQWRAQVDF